MPSPFDTLPTGASPADCGTAEKLMLVGDGEFAEIAYEYFTHDSEFEVVGFAVERECRKNTERFGLPVVDFEDAGDHFPPDQHSAFVALSQTQLNRPRTRLYHATKEKGYKLATYISSHAFVWRNVEVGENCFIFENNVLQHHVKLGNNVVLWSGNHIGHRSEICDNCFISSHVVISGFCNIGSNCFLGVNSTIANNIDVAEGCFIGAGSVIAKHTKKNQIYKGERAKASSIDTLTFFKLN